MHGQVDGLALAGLFRAIQRRKGRSGDHERVQVVSHVRSGKHRLLGGAVLHDDAGVSHHRQVVCGTLDHLRVALLAEAGNMDDNQLGVDLPKHLIRDALASPRAALRCLQEYVGILDHLEKNLLALI